MLVSIIIPVYKAEEFLEECVNSVLNQTYKNIELLLIDDGSPDNSGKICDDYAKKDNRVKVFHKENGGTHTARNLGIEKSTGEYVMFMDPDDWLDLDTVEILVDKISQDNLDVVRFNYIREFGTHSQKKANTFLKESVYRGDECKEICRQTIGLIGNELRCPQNLNFLSSVCFNIYKKSIIVDNKIEFFNIRKIGSFSDGLFNIEFYLHCNSFLFLDKGFYHYRKTNAGSATSNYRADFYKKQLVLFEKIKEKIDGTYDKDFDDAYTSRVTLTIMDLCLNVLRRKCKFKEKYNEIKEILKHPVYHNESKKIDISHMPIEWKVYYTFIKHQFVPGVYVMSATIDLLKKWSK